MWAVSQACSLIARALSSDSPVVPKSQSIEGALENGVTLPTYREMVQCPDGNPARSSATWREQKKIIIYPNIKQK